MHWKFLLQATLAGLLLVIPGEAWSQLDTKKRTAKIEVVNKTGMDLKKITVLHKYSDEFDQELSWSSINSGSTTSPQKDVDYYTGFFTTGRDWWILAFEDANGKVYISNPENFRKLMDGLEAIAADSSPAVIALFVDPSGGLATSAVSVIGRLAFNKAATFNTKFGVSFKQHILRPEDEDKVTQIVLGPTAKQEIEFISPSGKSTTRYREFTKDEQNILDKFTEESLIKLKKEIDERLKQHNSKPK